MVGDPIVRPHAHMNQIALRYKKIRSLASCNFLIVLSRIRSRLFVNILETMRRNCPQFVLKITLICRDIATLLQQGSKFLQPINTRLCQLKTELLGKLAQP